MKILILKISQIISNECHSYLKLHSVYFDNEKRNENEDEDDPLLTSQQLRAVLDSLKSKRNKCFFGFFHSTS